MRGNKIPVEYGETLTSDAQPRNQVEALEKELHEAGRIIKQQGEELLQLYRRLYQCDKPERSY